MRDPCANADGSPKRLFKSEAAAWREVRLTRANGPDPETLHAYRCPASGRRAHWHCGHHDRERERWQ